MTLYLQGENVVRNITYYNGGDTSVPANISSSLKFTDINGDGAVNGGSLYIPVKLTEDEIDAFVATGTNYNHWNAGIGGIDSNSLVQNFYIAGGKIQVVTTLGDNCTAIGAGGNGYCQMEISGGEVIAHCNGTGAAIGGGIGWNAAGGKSDVLISGGNVYAKNHAMIKSGTDLVGGVAIGSGSSFYKAGSEGKVTITGGTVEAYGTFGNGIGGGNSSTSTGGKATITISGGTVTATSIGGGNSKSGAGGNADVTVSGLANVTLEKGIGGGLSESGNGGAATITVNGGTIHSDGGIGGGKGGGNGAGGKAEVTVNDGTLTAQSIGGGQGSGTGNGGAAIVKINGGTIETGSIGGGQGGVSGQLGHATADITDGNITGQFLLKGAAQSCYFNMSGGTLSGVNTLLTENNPYAMENGAAVYMDDPNGEVTITGGTISDCSAADGGAVYMTAGSFSMSGDAVITRCTAAANGGAVYVGGGTVTMSGGTIENCSATENGGAVYLGNGTMEVGGGVIGCATVKDSEDNNTLIGAPNQAKNGGGSYLAGGNLTVSGGAISGNEANENGGGAFVNGGSVVVYGDAQVSNNIAGTNGGGIAVNNGNFSMEGGSVDHNQAVGRNGGGIYVSSSSTTAVTVDVLSGSVSNNLAGSSGGALAVKGEEGNPIVVTVGVNEDHFTAQGYPEHGDHDAFTCPVINNNTSNSSGGAVYVTGSKKAKLCIYCMTETGNLAGDASKPSDFMMVEGGTVEITTEESGTEESAQDGMHGHTVIQNTIYVVGGDVDIWGTMTNPDISNTITVDIQDGQNDEFDDHRIVGSGETEYYKLLYFENFTDPATGHTTGLYKQVRIQKGQTVTIDGFIYRHTGYEIGGWNTDPKNAVYSINGIQKDSNIDIYLSPVKKLPTIQSFVTEGQAFADFTDNQAIISRDSAYTARFVVKNFDQEAYAGKFVFTGLPEGTPLILMKKISRTTTYYRANASGNVPLASFMEMGTEDTKFSLGNDEQDVILQLVAVNSGDLSGNSVTTTFVLEHDVEAQPNAADVSGAVTTELKDEATFAILEDGGSVTLRYAPSAGAASIWNGRDNALVLKAATGTTLPEDAKLKYSYGGYNRDCSMNPEGLFVIPLGQLQPGDITLNFTLSTKMKSGTYFLDAEWYIARSQVETAPMNGIRKGTAEISLSAEKANVSVQISAQGHLYSAGDTLSAQIKVRGIEGYTTKLDIQRKVDGVYQSVDVAKTITGDCTQTFHLNYDPGSYRLYLYAYTSYSREETSFYFIIQ